MDELLRKGIDDWVKQLQSTASIFEAQINAVFESDSWKKIRDFFLNIPDDIKDTVLFGKVQALAAIDLKYEDMVWFIEELENNNAEQCYDFIKKYDVSGSGLKQYMKKIVLEEGLNIREKTVILMAHIEPLIFEIINHKKDKNEKVKNIVKDISVKHNSGMSATSIVKLFVLGITNVVFSNTDRFTQSVDKRIPFRNNILHNGIVEYTEEEVEILYVILIQFVTELFILGDLLEDEETQ